MTSSGLLLLVLAGLEETSRSALPEHGVVASHSIILLEQQRCITGHSLRNLSYLLLLMASLCSELSHSFA
jgi:hypothetical protein